MTIVIHRCEKCGREDEDVTFGFLAADPSESDGERWGYSCDLDEGCNAGGSSE